MKIKWCTGLVAMVPRLVDDQTKPPDQNICCFALYLLKDRHKQANISDFLKISKSQTLSRGGSYEATEFLDAQGVKEMSWPACPTDMNPIEIACDALGRALNERDNIPQSLQNLAQYLTKEWYTLLIDNINKLVDSMPQCLCVCGILYR
ncbi:hypothetical protein PAMP_017355 [Pampus punctatissimus]